MILTLNFKEKKIKFNLNRRSDFATFYQVFVENSYSFLVKRIEKGDIVIDAGANNGVFTVMASVLVGNKGKVVSIEPDPQNFQSLLKNIELNNLTNVILIQNALFSESNKKIPFHQEGAMSRLILSPDDKSEVDLYIETKTLDDIIQEYSLAPTILKMDIEGAEEYAILGMRKSLQTIKYIGAEIHNENCYNALIENYSAMNISVFPAESLHNVFKFLIKHPFKTLNIEFHNRFRTTKRVIKTRFSKEKEKSQGYPRLIYARK